MRSLMLSLSVIAVTLFAASSFAGRTRAVSPAQPPPSISKVTPVLPGQGTPPASSCTMGALPFNLPGVRMPACLNTSGCKPGWVAIFNAGKALTKCAAPGSGCPAGTVPVSSPGSKVSACVPR